jgi:elongation factor G
MNNDQAGFRETITTSAEARGRYVKQSSGPGIYGDVWLRVEPLARGQGFEFVNALVKGVLPDEFIPPVEEGVREAMAEGGPAGYPLVDLRVTLFNGSYHEVDSRVYDFKKAGSLALKAAVAQAHPIVLEL